jgi:hypothetical protein
MFAMTWGTADTIFRPPGAPTARYGAPSRSARNGVMFTSGRLPASMEFGRPGSGSNQIIPFESKSPVSGTTTFEPNRLTAVWVSDTRVLSPSTAHTCVVQSPVAPAAGRARRAARRPPSMRQGSTRRRA